MRKQIAAPRKLRLRINSATSVGNVDGFWWPHSRDFRSEATQLAEEFPAELGRMTRILYSAPDWDIGSSKPRARWLSTKNSRIKVGSFPNDDTSLLIVHTDRGMRLVLLVIPCEATSETLSESIVNRLPGSAIHAEYAVREIDPLAGWQDEGGHFG